jgi:hypothetical protein
VLDDKAGAPWWIVEAEDADPHDDHERTRTLYSVFIMSVGARAFRLLLPMDRSEHMALLALIDAEPNDVRQVEVST